MSHEIEGNAIPTPQFFTVRNFDLRAEARLASGKSVIDFVASKKEFMLGWVDLTGTEVSAILGYMPGSFFSYTYPTETGTDTVTVSCSDVPRELWLNAGSKRFRNIIMVFTEQ